MNVKMIAGKTRIYPISPITNLINKVRYIIKVIGFSSPPLLINDDNMGRIRTSNNFKNNQPKTII